MAPKSFSVTGNLVDIDKRTIYPVELFVNEKKISSIQPLGDSELQPLPYILPGFIDSHVHIESSMLVPAEFARLAVVHGTVSTVSDPHEIANVCGMEGVEFMINNGSTVPFKFNFGAPSCVPATTFETAGAALSADDVKQLLLRDDIKYLSEMMNFPGVLNNDEEVMKKIAAARALNKPVDGHAPGLRGEMARKYIQAALNPSEGGTDYVPERAVVISTDHECFTAEEALDKLQLGMKILIREGSAAKNFEALIGLLNEYPELIMFCSDDKHPDSLIEGHINQLCARAVAKGIDIFNVIRAACVNPVLHYKLDVGLLKAGDPADFILVDDLRHFNVSQTYINGELVAEEGKSFITAVKAGTINNFNCSEITTEQLKMRKEDFIDKDGMIPVIEALDGQLITNKLLLVPKESNGILESDPVNDILKVVVVNRYNNAPVAKCFIKNFGLKKGALASSVAHDSHNIVAVGIDDESLALAINLVIKETGGVSSVSLDSEERQSPHSMVLPLPVAGLMSTDDGYKVAEAYTAIDKMTKEELGSTLTSPFMTLSFMALLVIPHLKLSDKGLFDGDKFSFVHAQ